MRARTRARTHMWIHPFKHPHLAIQIYKIPDISTKFPKDLEHLTCRIVSLALDDNWYQISGPTPFALLGIGVFPREIPESL